EIFRLLDVPVDFVVGLDMMVEKSTPGFVDIPPGAHLLWVQQPGQNFRSAYWFVTGHRPQYKGHVRIKQWDRYNEVLGEVASRCERRSVLESIVEIYPHLKVYPSSTPTLVQPSGSTILTSSDSESAVAWQSPAWTRSPSPLHLWQALTDSISNEFLARVTSKKEVQDEYPVDSMDDRLEELQSSLGGRRRNVIPNLSSDLNFIFCLQTLKNMKKLPRSQRKSDDLFDLVIERLKDEKEDDLIAEMQFAFLTGTYLTNAACLGQWWDFVLHFALKAYKIAAMRPNLARRLIQTLHAQLLFTELQVASTSSPASSSTAERQPAEHDQKGDGPSGDRILYEARPYAQGKMTLQRGLEQFMTRLEADIKQRTGRLTKEHIEVCEAANDLGEWLFGLGWDVRHKRKMNPAEDDQGDEDSEDEDDLPVVVELDEDGREVGLVRFAD
ncbi:AAR2 protein-domain-containing protein, partial [Podospora australis]